MTWLDDFFEAIEANLFFSALCWLILLVGIIASCVSNAKAQVPAAAQPWRLPLTAFAADAWGPSAPIASFAAQVHQESGWRPNARSPVGAIGLTQFMPKTASWIETVFPNELGDGDPTNPLWSLRAMVLYDRWLYTRVLSKPHCERMAFALSAYNGGLGYVWKRQKLSKEPERCFDATCELNPGITPANQKENAHYPRRILREIESRYIRAGWGRGSC